jgi:adenylate cyclase
MNGTEFSTGFPVHYYFLALLLAITCPSVLGAQSNEELVEALDAAENNRERYGILYQLTENYTTSSRFSDKDLAIRFGEQLVRTARSIKDPKLLGPATYALGQAYYRDRNYGKTESLLKQSVGYAMQTGDADLILRATAQRTRIASRRQRYRDAVLFNQEALDYFTQNGEDNNIEVLRAQLEREQAALQRRRQEIDREQQLLAGEVERLRGERDELENVNESLTQRNQMTSEQLEASTEQLMAQSQELDEAQRQREAVEARVAASKREIKSLSREALEQKTLATEAREQLAQEALIRQTAEMEAERQATQRNIALGAGAGLFLLALTFFSRFRVKQRSAAKLARANTALDEARQQSDNLLENILPAEIARELKTTGKAKARRFPEVTVLFCDFVNFTQTAERLGAEALVQELDTCFKAFDAIVDRYEGVEKIKTIGDAYMVASGLSARKMLPNDIVRTALEMQRFLQEEGEKRRQLGLPYFTGRIGLHTGPVVAGVVGARKFAYDIWGDTVNVASRMESKSEAGRVNVSEDTYHLIKYRFQCTYRGKVEAKNKGMIDMYFVERELTENR